jgi:serine/threonine protein kinase
MSVVAVAGAEGEEIDEEDGRPIHALAPGADLVPGWQAWERLGVGHRCQTWLAWSPIRRCPAVVKVPRPDQLDHPRARRALAREVTALAGNLHPGLPALYQDGTRGDVPFVVTEFVDGPALDELLDDDGPLTEVETAVLGAQLCAALGALHQHSGRAHVDVKPANVMLRGGKPVLIDFGSARRLGARQPAGAMIGSPGYAAPELEAGAPISATMDAFGLGVTLFEARTAAILFDPDLAAAERPRPPVTEVGGLMDVVLALLADEPTRRPDLSTAWHELADIAAGGGVPMTPTDPSTR